jgi:hypothetical protein
LASSIGTEYYPRRPACAIRLGDRFPARRHTPSSPEGLEQPGVLGPPVGVGKRDPQAPEHDRARGRRDSKESRHTFLTIPQSRLSRPWPQRPHPGAAAAAAQWSPPPPARSTRKAAAARTESRATRQAKERGFRAETARGRPCLQQSGHRRNLFP